MRRHYTLVLKGHVAISAARFPKGTRGIDLDPLARTPCGSMGSTLTTAQGMALAAICRCTRAHNHFSRRHCGSGTGMILSNEPGFYKHGAYGIRIENLVLDVTEKNQRRRA